MTDKKVTSFSNNKGSELGLHCHEACIEQNVNDVLADSLCSFSRTHHKMKNTLKSQNRRLKHICKLKLIVQENELWRLINVKQITLKIRSGKLPIVMLLAVKYDGVTEYKTTYLPSLKSIFIKKGNIFGMFIRRQRSPSKLWVHSPAIQIHMFYTVHVL